MAEILPRHYLYASIMFVFFMVSGLVVIAEFNNDYPEFTNNEQYKEFNDSVYKMNEIENQVNRLESQIRTSEPDPGVFGVLNSLIQSSWQVLKLLFQSFSFIVTAFQEMSAVFGIPVWIAGTLTLLLVVVVTLGILSVIFQKEL